MELDRSLAFTALLELAPGFREVTDPREVSRLTNALATDMTQDGPKDRWAYARQRINDHLNAESKLVCGDCGDELTDNPERGPGREVTVEVSPGTLLFTQTTVYDQPEHLHADDNTPQCRAGPTPSAGQRANGGT
jgi:hypothetical protein